jgi:hypothetical protein
MLEEIKIPTILLPEDIIVNDLKKVTVFGGHPDLCWFLFGLLTHVHYEGYEYIFVHNHRLEGPRVDYTDGASGYSNTIFLLPNGGCHLHYTEYEEYWENIFLFAHQKDCQIFLSIQSYEMLEALYYLDNDVNIATNDNFCYVQMRSRNFANTINYDNFKMSIEDNYELR